MFFLKQVFTDITLAELQLLSKVLADRYALAAGAPQPLSKATAPGDKWPANRYPHQLLLVAATALCMSRRGMARKDVLDDNALAARKWGFGTPNYNSRWEGFLEDYLPQEALTWLHEVCPEAMAAEEANQGRGAAQSYKVILGPLPPF